MNRNRALWIVQGVLAALFAFAGGMKLITPVEVLSVMSPFPGEFIRFIGVCEVLGAIGLILPYALRILPGLTSLAAAGLVVIMVGATVTTLAIGGGVMALPTLVLGLLAALVAYGRRPQGRPARRLPCFSRPIDPLRLQGDASHRAPGSVAGCRMRMADQRGSSAELQQPTEQCGTWVRLPCTRREPGFAIRVRRADAAAPSWSRHSRCRRAPRRKEETQVTNNRAWSRNGSSGCMRCSPVTSSVAVCLVS